MTGHAIEHSPAIRFGTPVNRLAWKVEGRRSLLSRKPWLEVFQESVRLPDGSLVEDFYQIDLPDWVVVAARTAGGDLVVERHYRHGSRAISWTLPAGFIEEGEAPAAAARRELMEETGYEAGRWKPLGAFTVDGNRGCGRAHFYLADSCRRTADAAAGDHSPIEVKLMPFEDVLEALHAGEISELATATGLGLAAIEFAGAETKTARRAI